MAPTISALRRNLQTTNMSELQTAVFKATTDDRLPPKEKHVATVVRLAGEAASAEAVDTELAKRLHQCRAPKAASSAAKALVVLHRVVLTGHAGTALATAARALSTVCAAPEGRNAQADYVAECAAYLRALCGWDGAGSLRSDDAAVQEWVTLPPREAMSVLPQVQALTARALECAALGRSANGALHALRLGVLEDALCLVRVQSAAATALHLGLLRCAAPLCLCCTHVMYVPV